MVMNINPDGTFEVFDEVVALEKMFDHYLDLVKYDLPENFQILNAGCGWCEESNMMEKYFDGQMVCVDNNPVEIEKAKENYHGSDVEFFSEDIRSMISLYHKFDFVFTRNAFPYDCGDMNFFKACYHLTNEGGLLFSTFYLNQDRDLALNAIKKSGYSILLNEENQFAFKYPDYGQISAGVDRFLVVGIRKSKPFFAKISSFLEKLLYD